MRFLLAVTALGIYMAMAAGCATGPDVVVEPGYLASPARLLLIPEPKNDTVDLDAPEMVQNHLVSHVASKGYHIVGIEQTKRTLETKNIREGGQIDSLTSKELGELFGVDYVLYSNVLDFNTTTAVLYTSISVDLEFRLVRAATNSAYSLAAAASNGRQ